MFPKLGGQGSNQPVKRKVQLKSRNPAVAPRAVADCDGLRPTMNKVATPRLATGGRFAKHCELAGCAVPGAC